MLVIIRPPRWLQIGAPAPPLAHGAADLEVESVQLLFRERWRRLLQGSQELTDRRQRIPIEFVETVTLTSPISKLSPTHEGTTSARDYGGVLMLES